MKNLALIWREGAVVEQAERAKLAANPEPPSGLQRELRQVSARMAGHVPANDNHPRDSRLPPLARRFGGEIHGGEIVGASHNGKIGTVRVDTIGPYFEASEGGWTDRSIVSPPAQNIPQLPIINPADWEGVPVPARQWHTLGLIPARVPTLLSGDGGTGKSLLALMLGMSTALDCAAWGDVRPGAGRCLYIGAEDEAEEFQRRMAAILSAWGRSFSELVDFRLVSLADRDALLMVEEKGKMVRTPLLGQIEGYVHEFKPTFVVLDTSADLFGGDEIKRPQVRAFVRALAAMAIANDCAVLLLSHPSVAGMQTGTGLSGSTAWNNSVRSRLYLTQGADPDSRRLTTMKSNYGPKGGKIALKWRDGVFVLDDGRPSPAAGVLNRHYEAIFIEALGVLNRSGRQVGTSTGTNFAPAALAKLPEAKGATKPQLESAMNRLLSARTIKVVWQGPASRRRQKLLLSSEDFGPQDLPDATESDEE